MVSVGLDRASRGLTAIPSIRRVAGTPAPRAGAQRSAGRRKEGFLSREERRLPHRPETGNQFSEQPMRKKMPAWGRNLTDPLKARPPYGKGRLSAGPRARD